MINEVRWDITGQCNLNCGHCQAAIFYQNERKKGKRDLSTNEAKIVVDKLSEAGGRRVGILGGEPFMRNDIMQLLQYMHNQGLKVTINTNLTLLEHFDIDEIFQYCKAVFVSIDGTSAEEHDRLRGKGTYDMTMKNLWKLVDKKGDGQVNISYVMNKFNQYTTDEIFSQMDDLGVDACFVDVVHKVGNADTNWDNLGLTKEEAENAVIRLITSWDYTSDVVLNPRMYTNKFRDYLYKKTGIRLSDKIVWDAPGKTSFYILSDGTLMPTHFLAYMQYDKGFESKSLKDYSFDDIVNGETFREFMNLYDDKLPRTYYAPCISCEYCGKQCNPSPVSYWLGKKIPMDFCLV